MESKKQTNKKPAKLTEEEIRCVVTKAEVEERGVGGRRLKGMNVWW